MEKRQQLIIPKSIQKDISVSQFPSDAAIDIRNMRVVTTGDSTTLCLVNERGNKLEQSVRGTIIGIQVINKYIVVFTTDTPYGYKDAILKFTYENNSLTTSGPLYLGNLNFSTKHPIESIGIYENDLVQKVYWVDGLNQPRLINICNTYELDNDSQFDFIPKINENNQAQNLKFAVTIIPKTNADFTGEVIQYAISYYNKNRQQTAIIYQSPLYYTSQNGRGLNPDGSQKSSSTFRVAIKGLNTQFDYCKLYRISRSSINTTPSVECIGNYKTDSTFSEQVSVTRLFNSSNNLEVQYGNGGYYSSGEIQDILGSGVEQSKIYIGQDGVTAVNACAIINPRVQLGSGAINPGTNQPFYIRDKKTGIVYEIPEDRSVKIVFRSEEECLLDDMYTIFIADDYSPLDLPPGEEITGQSYFSGIEVYDNGLIGESVDPTELLYLGGTQIVADTITHKDNTLFLGNINTEKYFIPKEYKEAIKNNSSVYFVYNYLKVADDNTYLDTQWIFNSNLQKGSDEITHFQCGETYRFGVQLLSDRGIWSEVIYLKDVTNNLRIKPYVYNDGLSQRPVARADIYIPSELKDSFVGARLVCVYPELQDRTILCQGIVCPTVYNLKDRDSNSPYVYSSWFARPTYAIYNAFNVPVRMGDRALALGDVTQPIKNAFHKGFPLEYRMVNKGGEITDGGGSYSFIDDVIGLPESKRFNSEIYCIGRAPQRDYDNPGTYTRDQVIENYKNIYGIDKRIVTMHSPELDEAYSEELQNTALDGVLFRVVGFAPVKTTFSHSDIQYTNPLAPGFSGVYESNVESPSNRDNTISGYSLVNFPMWLDRQVNKDTGEPQNYWNTMPIYPWHRNGSLTNYGKIDNPDNLKSVLKSKTFSNLRVCLPTHFIDRPYQMTISDVSLWSDINSESICKINTSSLWGIHDIIYRGSSDKVLTYEGDKKFDELGIRSSRGLDQDSFTQETIPVNAEISYDNMSYKHVIGENISPVPIQYRSTSHAVFAFSKTSNGYYELLPQIAAGDFGDESTTYVPNAVGKNPGNGKLPWLSSEEIDSYKGLYQKNIVVDDDILTYGLNIPGDYNSGAAYYYIIGELYRTNVVNRFGGISEQALENNRWNPCGEVVYFDSTNNSTNTVTLYGTQGDTYFSRYDHLKTYPLATGNVNNIVEIVSFCCETRINIDGRYDRNRGNKNNIAVTPKNFNLFNPVYSQRNNFFNYRYIQDESTSATEFPNQVMWSKTKTLGEEIDSWTNINATNAIDLDGDKGNVNALRRFNNEIYSFQDTGISRILFNSRVQVNASDGIPIELANSGKVQGKVYITDRYGCQDKWSIAETPSGIYFVDNYNISIMCFNGQNVVDLTYTKNMYSWIKNNTSTVKWSPYNSDTIRTLYDRGNGDVYFTTTAEALSFNERLGAFSSFYDYSGVSWLLNMGDTTYQVKNNQFWKLHESDTYCTFFGNHSDYGVSVIANQDFQQDKTFDTIEFRTDGVETFTNNKSDNNKYPFYGVWVENEYQESVTDTRTLKKKFRTWRWQFDRNSKNGFTRDRIRNPWAKITLKGDSTEEVRLYDMVIPYYI